ncbi:MAG TPA: hypothetical protein VFR58_06060 [Flavisolibacter sp.]|nr:hypothetical protein [Flavisolibacter sp.]
MSRPRLHNWCFAFVLTLPMVFFFLDYFFHHDSSLLPTGFIQYDNVSYIAYARQYLDAEKLQLQYSNPFHDTASAPSYVQPQTFLFALLLRMGIPGGWILIPFTLLCSVIAFRLLIAIYDHLSPGNENRSLHIWLFAWGGGLLAAAGCLAHYYLGGSGSLWYGMFVLDPENGWWGLNFGRSLFFSCEAYYHALFLGCIYSLLKSRWAMGLFLLFFLSLSHPFTGIELIGIVGLWALVEFCIRRNAIPAWFLAGCLAAFCFHLWFYLVYLNQFPEHRSVQEQYTLNWRLAWYRMIPAYFITGLLAVASIYQLSVKKFFAQAYNRLFACWFLVAFLLANHELFIRARQPVHFTRGYIWTSLFLLGLPALHHLTKKWKTSHRKRILAFAVVVFLSDNFLWIGNSIRTKTTEANITHITREQDEILKWLDRESTAGTLVVSSDETVACLSTIRTSAYPWYSHPFTTPFAAEKKQVQERFLRNGTIDAGWLRRPVNYVLGKSDTAALRSLQDKRIGKPKETANFVLVKYLP